MVVFSDLKSPENLKVDDEIYRPGLFFPFRKKMPNNLVLSYGCYTYKCKVWFYMIKFLGAMEHSVFRKLENH